MAPLGEFQSLFLSLFFFHLPADMTLGVCLSLQPRRDLQVTWMRHKHAQRRRLDWYFYEIGAQADSKDAPHAAQAEAGGRQKGRSLDTACKLFFLSLPFSMREEHGFNRVNQINQC